MNRSVYQVVFLILSFIGVIVMINSVSWGSGSANNYLISSGGMDTARFMVIFQEYINTYRIIGIILTVIGGLGFLRCIRFAESQKTSGKGNMPEEQ